MGAAVGEAARTLLANVRVSGSTLPEEGEADEHDSVSEHCAFVAGPKEDGTLPCLADTCLSNVSLFPATKWILLVFAACFCLSSKDDKSVTADFISIVFGLILSGS